MIYYKNCIYINLDENILYKRLGATYINWTLLHSCLLLFTTIQIHFRFCSVEFYPLWTHQYIMDALKIIYRFTLNRIEWWICWICILTYAVCALMSAACEQWSPLHWYWRVIFWNCLFFFFLFCFKVSVGW